MLGFQGPAQPSPTLGEALNGGYAYLEIRCLGSDTSQTVALDIVRRPKATLPPVFGSPGLCLQAQPSGCFARDKDIGQRSACMNSNATCARRRHGGQGER
jgi:hypothetical protein